MHGHVHGHENSLCVIRSTAAVLSLWGIAVAHRDRGTVWSFLIPSGVARPVHAIPPGTLSTPRGISPTVSSYPQLLYSRDANMA